MDDADRAGDRQETELERAIAAARRTPEVKANGRCFYCEEPVEGGRLYCDQACRDDHERERSLRARQGVR